MASKLADWASSNALESSALPASVSGSHSVGPKATVTEVSGFTFAYRSSASPDMGSSGMVLAILKVISLTYMEQAFPRRAVNILPGMMLWKKYKLHWLTSLRGNDLTVYLCLNWHANGSGWAWPAIKTIIQETGLPRSSVYVALSNLSSEGWVERHQFKRTEYLVCDPEESKNQDTTESQFSDTESRKLDTDSKNQDGPILIEKNQEEKNEVGADKPRIKKEAAPSSTTGEENFLVKISNVRRNKTGRDEQDAPTQGKPRKDWMRAHSLAQHLAMHTRKDYRIYLGSGQNAAWMRLLEIWPYERVRDSIDEAVSPSNRPKLERGDYTLNAHAIEFFMKSIQKREEDQTDEDRELAARVAKMWETAL
jgi:DNA-binding MltR family transcriptional regulator